MDRSRQNKLNAKKLWRYFLGVIILCLVLMLLTYYKGLWKIELVYSNTYNKNKGIFDILPNIVLKAKKINIMPAKDESPKDLVTLMREINVRDFSTIHMPICSSFFNGNLTSIKEGIIYERLHFPPKLSDSRYSHMTRNCQTFIQERKYITKPVSQEEAEFPIAFSILVYENAEQFEMLLRAIFRPQNYYCIHIDRKSSGPFHTAVRTIASCFTNVFIASKNVDVQWGTFSVLDPELTCMEELWKYPNWKYFINLTGKEYPLKTNLDIVKILKLFNGANNMEASVLRRNTERTGYVYEGRDRTDTKKEPPPIPVTLTKGSVHITASRAFVGYVLHDPRALTFRVWVNNTGIPDETFFSSLGHSPQLDVPGAYKGEPETDPKMYPFLTRFKNWGSWPFDFPCYGQRLRRICIFGIGDLPQLAARPELFANKFSLSFQPRALHCMEEWLTNRTMKDIQGIHDFDTSSYKNYDFVQNSLRQIV